MMQALTEKLVAELDLLYGLYQLAVDYARKVDPKETEQIAHWLDARHRILGRTEIASRSAIAMLEEFEAMRNVPASERALVEEKRRMLQDLSLRLAQADGQALRKMNVKAGELRKELAQHSERGNALRAYVTVAPRVPIGQMATG